MSASTTTYSLPMASRCKLGAFNAHGMDRVAARGYVTLARRYAR
jgi:hypothetical protein